MQRVFKRDLANTKKSSAPLCAKRARAYRRSRGTPTASSPRRCMTASPMRRADANRLVRVHEEAQLAPHRLVAVVSARALRVRSASRSRSLCSRFSSSISRACRWRSVRLRVRLRVRWRRHAPRDARGPPQPRDLLGDRGGAGSGGVVSERVGTRAAARQRGRARRAPTCPACLLELGAQPGQLGLDRVHARAAARWRRRVSLDAASADSPARRGAPAARPARRWAAPGGLGAGAPLRGRREDPAPMAASQTRRCLRHSLALLVRRSAAISTNAASQCGQAMVT